MTDDIQKIRYQAMIDEGYEVLIPHNNQLLLDMDWDCDETSFLARFTRLLSQFRRIEVVLEVEYSPSNTVRHWHGRVKLARELSFQERQMYEMMLGSDVHRAMWNIEHFKSGSEYPELLTTNVPQWKAMP